jgi:hypothetical protein
MTNAGRNSLVLSLILFLMVSGTLFMVNKSSKQTGVLVEENTKTEAEIAVLNSQISNIDSLIALFEMRKAMIAEQSKVLLKEDSPTSTYQYLLRLMGWMKANIIYDFAASKIGTDPESGVNSYVISGRANYLDVANLARYIEYQRALLTIEEISLGSDGIANSDTVSFSMVLNTHYHSSGLDWADLVPARISAPLSSYQLFRSLVWDSAQYDEREEQNPNLVNIDNSILIGVGESRIFLRDNQGIIRILNLRDRVLGGYLYSIDLRDNKAVFKVDKFGLEENQVLHLIKEN